MKILVPSKSDRKSNKNRSNLSKLDLVNLVVYEKNYGILIMIIYNLEKKNQSKMDLYFT